MSLLNFFFPQKVNFPDSKYNINISLIKYFPEPTLIVDGLIQSGSILTHIWKTGLKKLLPRKYRPQKILILGIGGGSNTNLCRKLFPHAHITAVDIDPLMVEIARKYFCVREDNQLQIVIADALRFAEKIKPTTHYDLVLLDCFEGKYIPEKLENPEFIRTLKDHSTHLLINRIYWYEHGERTRQFLGRLSEHFFYISAQTRSNIIINLL